MAAAFDFGSMNVAMPLQIAAKISQYAGEALSPVAWINQVEINGVNPPKMATARLKANEKPTVLASGGMISVSVTIAAPL